MSMVMSPDTVRRSRHWLVNHPAAVATGLVLLALIVRLVFFVGYQGRDDRNYLAYAQFLASGQNLAALDVRNQWVGRVGFWIPVSASMRVFGTNQIGYVAYPLMCSLAGVLLTFALGNQTVGRKAATLAAALLAIFPLDVLYSTRAYPDVPLGVLMVAAYWLAIWSSTHDAPWWVPCGSGLALGAAYLQKETALFAAVPILFVLRFWSRRHRRPLVLVGLSLCLVLAAELIFWNTVKSDPLYRFHAAGAALKDVLDQSGTATGTGWLPGPKPTEIYRSGNSLLDAALMLGVNEEFGILFWLTLPMMAVGMLRSDSSTRDLRTWILMMLFLVLFFPVHWPRYTMPRDPRYLTCVAIPSLLLCAHYLLRMRLAVRILAALLFVASGVGGMYFGKVSSIMEPQKHLLTRAVAGEHLWVTPQFGADLLFMGGLTQPISIGIHFLEQRPTAGSFQAVQLIRPAVSVAESPATMAFGTLVLRDERLRPPLGWHFSDRIKVQPPWLIARAQALLVGVGLENFATKLAPGGGVTATLYRLSRED